MKTIIALCLAFAALAAARAQDPSSLDEVVRKRDAVLAQILDSTQSAQKTGIVMEARVHAAAMNLYVFRRDSAKTQADRLQWQKRIVVLEQEGLANVTQQVGIGTAMSLDKLLAEERVLAAEQKLAEILLAK
jgi:hypothetical protein